MFTIRYDTRILDDIAHMPRSIRARLRDAIEAKLASQPEVFDKPLRHSLAGFRSLRVGEYRVIYLIRNSDVFVMLIAHRKDVYVLAQKRA